MRVKSWSDSKDGYDVDVHVLANIVYIIFRRQALTDQLLLRLEARRIR